MVAYRSPNGARRHSVITAAEDAFRLGLRDGDAALLRNHRGVFSGRVKADRIKPSCLQAHWPEVNVIIPAGRFDSSGVPDDNVAVEVVAAACLEQSSAQALAPAMAAD